MGGHRALLEAPCEAVWKERAGWGRAGCGAGLDIRQGRMVAVCVGQRPPEKFQAISFGQTGSFQHDVQLVRGFACEALGAQSGGGVLAGRGAVREEGVLRVLWYRRRRVASPGALRQGAVSGEGRPRAGACRGQHAGVRVPPELGCGGEQVRAPWCCTRTLWLHRRPVRTAHLSCRVKSEIRGVDGSEGRSEGSYFLEGWVVRVVLLHRRLCCPVLATAWHNVSNWEEKTSLLGNEALEMVNL